MTLCQVLEVCTDRIDSRAPGSAGCGIPPGVPGYRDRMSIRTGTTVRWNWGNGSAIGKVKERFTEQVTRTIEGSEITKNGTDDCPAYLIEQDDGGRVLKLQSEVERA